MNVHENVILDLLPGVRSGQASAESRALVERYLEANPQIARFAALMPTPDPDLEMRTLLRTRQHLGRRSMLMGLAIFFTLLPLSFIVDARGFRFLFAEHGMMFAFLPIAAVLWLGYFWKTRTPTLR